jgi:hypothetical protein
MQTSGAFPDEQDAAEKQDASMAVDAFPPSDAERRWVSFESRYGTCWLSPSLSRLITGEWVWARIWWN